MTAAQHRTPCDGEERRGPRGGREFIGCKGVPAGDVHEISWRRSLPPRAAQRTCGGEPHAAVRQRRVGVNQACVAGCLALLLLPAYVWGAPSSLNPRNAPTSGGNTITVIGISGQGLDEFGLAESQLKVRIGGTAATSTQRYRLHPSSRRCMAVKPLLLFMNSMWPVELWPVKLWPVHHI